MFGFEAHEGATAEVSRSGRDYANGSVDVPEKIQAVNPQAKVSHYGGHRMVFWHGSGQVQLSKSNSTASVHDTNEFSKLRR